MESGLLKIEEIFLMALVKASLNILLSFSIIGFLSYIFMCILSFKIEKRQNFCKVQREKIMSTSLYGDHNYRDWCSTYLLL